MPVLILLLLALAAEIAVVVAIGQAIGALTTVLLLIAVSMLGVALLRRQGARTLTAFVSASRRGRDASPEAVDGVLLAGAAALVIFPGFVSDVVALFLLIPATRALVRRPVLRWVARARDRAPVFVVDSEVVDTHSRPQQPIVIESHRADRD